MISLNYVQVQRRMCVRHYKFAGKEPYLYGAALEHENGHANEPINGTLVALAKTVQHDGIF
jgi:hypothetical protein